MNPDTPTTTQAISKTLTAYRVLKFSAPPSVNNASSAQPGYQDVGGVTAANAQAAIKTIAEKNGAGTYVAVPESSWKPVTVTVETQTVIKLT
jgi:hypothetical protein